MTPALRRITISNFRSIRGTVSLPLDAPVVLIHGPNGAGKTSVLSAIELALTGSVPALRRSDPAYLQHLVHTQASHAEIAVEVTVDGAPIAHELRVGGTAALAGLLSPTSADFFSERCVLAQSTLGRLLEIYQSAQVRGESALTRFVKDLLRIDRYDALVDGLAPAGDIRNLRKLVPELADAEQRIGALEDATTRGRTDVRDLGVRIRELRRDVRELLLELGVAADDAHPDLMDEAEGAADVDNSDIVALTAARQELRALMARWQAFGTTDSGRELTALETEAARAQEAAAAWTASEGGDLVVALEEAQRLFSTLRGTVDGDPRGSHQDALSAVNEALAATNASLADDETNAVLREEADRRATAAAARVALAEQRLQALSSGDDLAALAAALAGLLPHLGGDVCPVCNRDFAEVSDQPLAAHLSNAVSRLTAQAQDLQALNSAKVQAAADLRRAEDDRAALIPRVMSAVRRAEVQSRAAQLETLRRRLIALTDSAARGANVVRQRRDAERALLASRDRDEKVAALRTAADELVQIVGGAPAVGAQPLASLLPALSATVDARLDALAARDSVRRELQARRRDLLELGSAYRAARSRLDAQEAELNRWTAAVESANARRTVARAVARAATQARTAVVREVFNESLNSIWRELFVRLAPSEPFVPAFRLPAGGADAVTAQLETINRRGGRGGAPGTMLSAGNLNTAALTLFLALHLSAPLDLPWLLLDDPVQSMDDVHIAQFAALLRTLSKELGRQIVVAVHDRALFEYLRLELSPATETDRLITLELARAIAGDTTAETTYVHWHADTAFPAA